MFLAEVFALILVGEAIGLSWAVLIVVVASVAGLILLRREGLRAWHGFREAAAAGRPPGPQVADGLIGLGGALLLAAPGMITGVVGLALLTPPVRRLVRGRVRARAERRMTSAQAGEMFGPRRVRVWQEDTTARSDVEPAGTGPETAETVEGEVVDSPDQRSRGPHGQDR